MVPGWVGLLLLVCVLQHEDGVVDLQRRAQLDRQDLDDVGLGEQQEGLAVYLLKRENRFVQSVKETFDSTL